jgi:hypothetical protein
MERGPKIFGGGHQKQPIIVAGSLRPQHRAVEANRT